MSGAESGGQVRIEPVRLDRAPGLQRAVAAVARERRYLVSVEGFSVDETRAFVQSLLNGWGIQHVALHGEEVVGWCDVRRSPWIGFEHVGDLGMGVVAGWRGQGLGARLLTATLEAAVALNLSRVELEVFASNARAIGLYERFGFRREGLKRRARILDGQVDDIVLMARVEDLDFHPRSSP